MISKLLTSYKIDACFRNRSYGKGALRRDVNVRDWCAKNHVACHTSQDYLLVEPEQVPVRKVFTPFYMLRQQVPKQLPEEKVLSISSFPKECSEPLL
jgi:deoxyribodipyrimidine photolyase